MIWLFFLAFVVITYVYGFAVYKAVPLFIRDLIEKVRKKKNQEDLPFDLYGVFMFCGRVGCGKTISMVRRARQLKRKFPRLRVYANFTTSVADGQITCWQDLLEISNIDENGVNQGVLFLFDEIHLTFSSQGWKSAPHNLLEYISLQRHLHKCIFGASQVWSRVNKIIKEQTDYVIECKSYLGGRLIKNTCYNNEDYQINGTQKDSGQRKRPQEYMETFCADDELRSLYDTDEIISGLSITAESEDEKIKRSILNALHEAGSA